MATILLMKEGVRGLIRMPDVITAVEDAFRVLSGGEVEHPPYVRLHLSQTGAEIDFKACYHAGIERVSLKASSGGFCDNTGHFDLPNGMDKMLLLDGSCGALLCAMDGSLLTGFRTGAAGAVSVQAMACENARVLAMIGNGNPAGMQVRAIRAGLVADVQAEFGEVLLGRATGREPRDQITAFDSTGMAIQDTTTAILILRLEQECGIGAPFDVRAPES